MKVVEIYKKFGIPPNLDEHMARVFGVVTLIEKHWKNQEKVDWDLLKKMALIHDLGNVVKFDFDKHPEFLGKESNNLDFWKNIQSEMIKKYGTDDNESTRKMLTEIGLDQEVVDMIFDKRFINTIHTSLSNNWLLIILHYADLRVLPLGIGTLEERITDIRERYTNYTSRSDFEDLVKACHLMESKIQENLDIPVNDINNEVVNTELAVNQDLIEDMEI